MVDVLLLGSLIVYAVNELKSYDFEYWDSLDSRNVILLIEAESKTEAVKEFKMRHPHKKFRLLEDQLDE